MKKLTIIIAVIVFIVVSAIYFKNSKIQSPPSPSPTVSPTPFSDNITPVMVEDQYELISEDLKIGTGEEALTGKTVTVNYKGTLTTGEQFDSSYDRGEPFSFVLGASAVIQGWDKGVVGMKVGGTRKLTIPASLGYGARAIGSIPANSTLIFEIELLGVK